MVTEGQAAEAGGDGGRADHAGGGGDFTSNPWCPSRRCSSYVNMICASLVSPYEACFSCERKAAGDRRRQKREVTEDTLTTREGADATRTPSSCLTRV